MVFCIAVFCAAVLSGCASALSAKQPVFLSALHQYAVYSGEPQPVDARASTDAPLVVSYFTSAEALSAGSGGSAAAPVDAGLYYARVEQAGAAVAVVEYLIDRAWVNISARATQEALYDGNPKRVTATTGDPVPLSVSYFPTRQARAAAAVLETRPEQRVRVLRGLTRVVSPPKEPGTYFVSVYYQGDGNYLPTVREIEFTIRGREPKSAR